MSRDAHLWKFWMWELVLVWVLCGAGLGVSLYFPEAADSVSLYFPEAAEIVRAQGSRLEIAGAVLALGVITALAYRLATGTLAGLAKWFARLLGSGLVVSLLILLPLVLLKYVLKPDYLSPTSPFVALFVLWCLYGIVFLIRWQTRLWGQVLK